MDVSQYIVDSFLSLDEMSIKRTLVKLYKGGKIPPLEKLPSRMGNNDRFVKGVGAVRQISGAGGAKVIGKLRDYK